MNGKSQGESGEQRKQVKWNVLSVCGQHEAVRLHRYTFSLQHTCIHF